MRKTIRFSNGDHMKFIQVELIFVGHRAGAMSVDFKGPTRDKPPTLAEFDYYNLPASQIKFDPNADPGAVVEVELPEWLAIKKGLV